jgi:hypothetical protein
MPIAACEGLAMPTARGAGVSRGSVGRAGRGRRPYGLATRSQLTARSDTGVGASVFDVGRARGLGLVFSA